MWPSVRNRWWAILTHPAIGPIETPKMPSIGWDPSVFHLMPQMMPLDEQSLRQLELDIYELRHFHNQPGGIARSAFHPFRPMPTATHSWGSQVKGCHCGCRSSGFSAERVANRGLYGVLIPLDRMVESVMGPYHAMRHPHPMEVAFVNGLGLEPAFVNTTNSETLRLALAGVGQLASPLQSNWIWGNVLPVFHNKGLIAKMTDPCGVLTNMCKSLFVARDELLGVNHKTKYMEIFESAINMLGNPSVPGSTEMDDPKISQLIHQRCTEIGEQDEDVPEDRTDKVTLGKPENAPTLGEGKGGTIPSRVETPKETEIEIVHEECRKQFATNSTGGVLGFETAKRRKIETQQNHGGKDQPNAVQGNVGPDDRSMCLPVEVSPTMPWTKPVDYRSFGHIGKEAFQEEVIDQCKTSCRITTAGASPIQVEFVGDIRIQQALSAEVALGNAEDESTVRTSVGTFVAPEHNIQSDQTYVIFPPHDGLNDDKCPKTHPVQPPNLDGQTRLHGLYQQKGWVALGEMEFYFRQIGVDSMCNVSSPMVLPENPAQGIDLARWILQGIEIANASNMAYTTCLISSHWVPLKLEVKEETTSVKTLAGDVECNCSLWRPINPDIRVNEQLNRHVFPADCGFQAAAWIRHQIRPASSGQTFPMTATEAGQWRQDFAQYLVENQKSTQIMNKIRLGGMPDTNTKGQLQQLLVRHGVSNDRVDQCGVHPIENLGLKTIQQVLGSLHGKT